MDILFPLVIFLGLLSPAVAIICATGFYADHCRARPNPERRLPVVGYVLILLVCAVFAFPFGLAFGVHLACDVYPSGNLCGLIVIGTGPLAASLAIYFVGGLILFLPPDVEPVNVGTSWRFSAVYLKLWRGQYSLTRSFWFFFILGTYVVMISSLLLQPIRPVLVLGYDIIAGVGVWRSANAFISTRGGCPSLTDSAKAIAAKIVVVLWLLWWVRILLRIIFLLGALGFYPR